MFVYYVYSSTQFIHSDNQTDSRHWWVGPSLITRSSIGSNDIWPSVTLINILQVLLNCTAHEFTSLCWLHSRQAVNELCFHQKIPESQYHKSWQVPTHRVWWVAPSLLKPINVKGYGYTTWPKFDQWDLNKSYIYDCYFLRRPPIPDSVCAYIFHLRVRLLMLFPVNLLHISTYCLTRNAVWYFKVTICITLGWIPFSSGQRRAVFSTPHSTGQIHTPQLPEKFVRKLGC